MLNVVCISDIVVGSGECADDGEVSLPPRVYASLARVSET